MCFAAHFFILIRRCSAIGNENRKEKEHLINEDLYRNGFSRSSEIRVIGDEGEQLGIITVETAISIAEDRGLDLVLISPQSDPPVCRILDYGKFIFDRDKKKKEAKKKQQKVDIKEVQLSCQIDVNDFNTKANNAKKFLTSGNKVKVVVTFKGRQMAHQDVGRELIERFLQYVADVGTNEKPPVLEGRAMSVMLSPVKQTATKKDQQNN